MASPTVEKRSQTEETAKRSGDVLFLDLWYPHLPKAERSDARVTTIEVGLMDVRAADSVRVSYDFERDGWVIKQAAVFEWSEDDTTNGDSDWQEVAFVPAWGQQRVPPRE
jgi:hypothetical protein